MASKPSLDDRILRLEARRPRKTEAEEAEMRMLRAMSTPDLRRLEAILSRIEGPDRLAKLTAPERTWLTELGYDV